MPRSNFDRRVSFAIDYVPKKRCMMSGPPRRQAPPPATTTSLPPTASPSSILKKRANIVVLHGRIVPQPVDDVNYVPPPQPLLGVESEAASFRSGYERRAAFYNLKEEFKEYEVLVTKLERLQQQNNSSAASTTSGDSNELAWRIRVLAKSAQEMDKNLFAKLFSYEKTLLATTNANLQELRSEQTACMKLHRDFKLTHKTLLMCLSRVADKYQTTASSGMQSPNSQIGAVGWTAGLKAGCEEEEKKEEEKKEEGMKEEEKRENPPPRAVFIASSAPAPSEYVPTYKPTADPKRRSRKLFAELDQLDMLVEESSLLEREIEFVAADNVPVKEVCISMDNGDRRCCGVIDACHSPFEKLQEDMTSIKKGIKRVGETLGCGAVNSASLSDNAERDRLYSPRQASF